MTKKEYLAVTYDKNPAKAFFDRYKTEIRGQLPKYNSSHTMLDLGSGNSGSALCNMLREETGIKTVSIDNFHLPFYEPQLVMPISAPNYTLADATALPIKNESLDLVVATSLTPMSNPAHGNGIDRFYIASEVYKALKQNGQFVFTTNKPYDSQAVEILKQIGFKKYKHLFSATTLDLTCENAPNKTEYYVLEK